VLVLPANKGKRATVSKIATMRCFTPFPYLDQIKAKKIVVSEVNSAEAAIKIAMEDRVEGVYLGTLAANYIMSEGMKKPGVLVYDDKLPHSSNDFSMSSIAHPQVIKHMDDFWSKKKIP
jgi:polar amino acid transport system substrate-binding protein